MRTTDKVEIMLLQESCDNIGAKCKRDTTIILAPTLNILLWIRPKQITQQAYDQFPCKHRGEWRGSGFIVVLPVSGTSVGRITRRICSMLCKSGDKPPCIQKIFSSIMAAIGRQLKQSVKVFQSLMLYRRLPIGNPIIVSNPCQPSS